MTHNNTFGMMIDIVYDSMPRDNLLNSACLELFEFVKRENIKPIVLHIVEKYHDKLKEITYVDTFQDLILRYEQLQGYGADVDSTLYSQEDETPLRKFQQMNGQRWQGVKEMDAAEEAYFNADDDEEDVSSLFFCVNQLTTQWPHHGPTIHPRNGAISPMVKPLVDYPDDDDDVMDTNFDSVKSHRDENVPLPDEPESPTSPVQAPPERLSEKRRREEEDEDELAKLSTTPKRRNSTSSAGSESSLRRKRSMAFGSAEKESDQATQGNPGGAPKKIAINLNAASRKLSSDDTQPATGTESEASNQDGGQSGEDK